MDKRGKKAADKGNKVLPSIGYKPESRCKVCQSTLREQIDRLVIAGFPDTAIAQQVRGMDPHLSGSIDAIRKSIERHRTRHADLKSKTSRAIIERRAREAGISVEDSLEQLATTKALLELVVAKGMDQVTDPETRVKFQDALKAAELLESFDREEHMTQLTTLQSQAKALAQAMREIVPSQYHQKVIERAYEIHRGETFVGDISLPEITDGTE